MDNALVHNPVDQPPKTSSTLTGRLLQKLVAPWKAYFKVEVKPHALEQCPLRVLPREVISLIADFLPSESVAAFAFCCRPINDLLGRSSWDDLRSKSSEAKLHKMAFISLLEKGMPDHIACQACLKLHRVDKSFVKDPGPRTLGYADRPYIGDLACVKQDMNTRTHDAIYENFRYPIFQMVMKRHRLGLDTAELLKLLRFDSTYPYYGHMRQDTAEARIIQNSLYVRVQHIFMLPLGQAVELPKSYGATICRHLGSLEPRLSNIEPLARVLRCRTKHWTIDDNQPCPTCSEIISCESCPTEFHFDIVNYDEHGVALIATKWQALGCGLDYEDPVWFSHLYTRAARSTRVVFEPRTISATFENNQPFQPDTNIPKIRKDFFGQLPLLFQRAQIR
ncbi:uncharacterized protein LY89DRAFT_113641 [Mollisia scopiformis]|uniref:F-box domain-containing protein n=1 Tax=Mollisia scopiformis TaxID=149040 RepID=A0A194X6N1_MOLSC|nr:uncharacterized protein LY89DRAFT_113641 [Mollisia scopiformis]KUJ15462.1 hypothetical protein LY89DRAFT_113641 [Mollisia scopiformis]